MIRGNKENMTSLMIFLIIINHAIKQETIITVSCFTLTLVRYACGVLNQDVQTFWRNQIQAVCYLNRYRADLLTVQKIRWVIKSYVCWCVMSFCSSIPRYYYLQSQKYAQVPRRCVRNGVE